MRIKIAILALTLVATAVASAPSKKNNIRPALKLCCDPPPQCPPDGCWP